MVLCWADANEGNLSVCLYREFSPRTMSTNQIISAHGMIYNHFDKINFSSALQMCGIFVWGKLITNIINVLIKRPTKFYWTELFCSQHSCWVSPGFRFLLSLLLLMGILKYQRLLLSIVHQICAHTSALIKSTQSPSTIRRPNQELLQ